jgi:hypothetical protein
MDLTKNAFSDGRGELVTTVTESRVKATAEFSLLTSGHYHKQVVAARQSNDALEDGIRNGCMHGSIAYTYHVMMLIVKTFTRHNI